MTQKKKAPVEIDFNKVILLLIALATLGNTYLLYKTQQNVQMVEKQTNHIKDQLVAATDLKARAEGNAAGRAEEKAENKKENE